MSGKVLGFFEKDGWDTCGHGCHWKIEKFVPVVEKHELDDCRLALGEARKLLAFWMKRAKKAEKQSKGETKREKKRKVWCDRCEIMVNPKTHPCYNPKLMGEK